MNLSKLLWIIAGILAVALVGFLGFSLVVKKDTVVRVANDVSVQEVKKEEENNSEGVKPVAQQTTVEYKNTEFGFSLQLPASWKGYKTNVYKVERDNYFTVGVTHPTEKIYPPVDFPSTAKPIEKTYSFIVVPIATWNKWYVTGEGAQPFAAGVGASEFGRNSQYVFAIAPRYLYGAYVYGENVSENDKKEGEQIARSFKFFEPTFKSAQKTNTDWQKEWQKYLPNANFLEMKDITGDGVPEVLVNSFVAQGGSGTSVSKVLVFTIKNNKAVEIPVYENGVKRELSQYSGNVQASRVLFTNEGVEEQQRRGKGLNPGVYEILDSKIVFSYNKNSSRLEYNTKIISSTTQPVSKTNTDWQKEWERLLVDIPFDVPAGSTIKLSDINRIREIRDITGDGVPEAFVWIYESEAGGSGRADSCSGVFQIKSNKPVHVMTYRDGLEEKSCFSQNGSHASSQNAFLTNTGVEVESRSTNGVFPFIYEILDGQYLYVWNKSTERLEDTTKNSTSLEKMKIKVYRQNQPEECGATNQVLVEVPKTVAVADASLRFLFRHQLGRYGVYDSVEIQNGIAKIYIYQKIPSLSSCEHEHLFSVLEKTLTQYPTIQKVELYRASDRSKIEF